MSEQATTPTPTEPTSTNAAITNLRSALDSIATNDLSIQPPKEEPKVNPTQPTPEPPKQEEVKAEPAKEGEGQVEETKEPANDVSSEPEPTQRKTLNSHRKSLPILKLKAANTSKHLKRFKT